MSKRSAIDWLSDIISWGERLEGHLAGMTQEDFLDDAKTQDAASKCAEAIGMAAHELNNLEPSLDREFPDLQLNLAYKSRNRLSHGYFAVDESILWSTVSESIPKTVAAAKRAKLKYVSGADGGHSRSPKL